MRPPQASCKVRLGLEQTRGAAGRAKEPQRTIEKLGEPEKNHRRLEKRVKRGLKGCQKYPRGSWEGFKGLLSEKLSRLFWQKLIFCSMKSVTEPLFSKTANYKQSKGLRSP